VTVLKPVIKKFDLAWHCVLKEHEIKFMIVSVILNGVILEQEFEGVIESVRSMENGVLVDPFIVLEFRIDDLVVLLCSVVWLRTFSCKESHVRFLKSHIVDSDSVECLS